MRGGRLMMRIHCIAVSQRRPTSQFRTHLLPAHLATFVLFFQPAHERDFRKIAALQLGEEIPRVHRVSPGALIGGKHFLDERLET